MTATTTLDGRHGRGRTPARPAPASWLPATVTQYLLWGGGLSC